MTARALLDAAQKCLDRGDAGGAERLCRQALALDERDSDALQLLALAAARAGRLDDALAAARDAVGVAESDPACHATLGRMLTAAGRHAEAIVTLQRAVALRPGYAQANLHLGDAYVAARSPAAAEDAYRAALAIWGDYPEAHMALGRLLFAQQRGAEALAAFDTLVRLQPESAEAHLCLAEVNAAGGNTEAALAAYRRATEAAPRSAPAWHALGRNCQSLGRIEEAARAFRRGIEAEPDHVGCLLGLASALEAQMRWEEAAQALRRVLARIPDHPDALKGLARALFSVGNLPEALHLVRRAAELSPNDPDAHYGLGNVWLRLQRPQESLASYRRALALVQTPKARFAEASPLLMAGDFAAGWEAYEARLGMAGVPWKIANVRERLWDGGALGRQTLLVHTEQGLGDSLQFIRYLPLVRRRAGPAARILLLCEPELAGVLGTAGGFDSLHAPDRLGGIDYDVQIPLLSLPQRFGATLDTIPAQVPYIGLPAGAGVRIERRAGCKLTVAFAWAGRPTHSDDRMRSCPVERFAALFDVPGVQFVSIQHGPRAADIEPWLARQNVASMSGRLTDLAATLSVIDQADLVIAVDTSVVHLAGAYGKRVWTLLAFGAEWRWLLNRDDSPWYPTMRLFRQRTLGDWDEVFARVRAELERMTG